MANKPRTPPPPRRPVQAPQRRSDPRTADDRRKLLLLAAFAAAGLIALAIVIGIIAFGGGKASGGGDGGDSSDPGVTAAMQKAGCTVTNVEPTIWKKNQTHTPSLTTKVPWNTYPPAGGSHYPVPAIWGFYDDPVEPIRLVHNEEHGGVILWWGPQTPKSEIEKLRDFYNEDPVSIVGSPVGTIDGKSLGSKVAITAWTGDVSTYTKNGDYGIAHDAVCPRFDESAFKKFRDAYRGKGPEGISMSSNQPGT